MTTLAAPRRTAPPPPSTRPRGPQHSVRAGLVAAYATLAVVAFAWLLPFLWALNTSFKSETDASALPVSVLPEGGYTTSAYRAIVDAGNVPLWMGNSALVAVAVTVLSLVVSTLTAYAFSRLDFPGRKALYVLTIASIMVPTQIFIVPLFDEMLALGLVDTYWGIILPQLIHPAMIFVLKRFFDEVPQELEDAALVDGASRLRIFLGIVLPLSRPIIAAVAIFIFIGAWNNFLWPFIVTNNPALMTLPVGLQAVTPGYGVTFALKMAQAVIAALPLIVVFVFFQRQIIRSISTTGIAGT
ncbi:binding-protein-dependent transport systems inner membrane component [Beutenbergia cavernae DSM 12333]|uniref:Binding-protein-dependent transport systems inner membrane component n=1 Tax=Beutenbergia cavernae (strain ATCC BAA-8 / DSM 12333 / CCUG 43141 / JCM 11478 / NBRC 16432 / NCIMB 13614 / HKI 0122) TaxID=471853 RepID=C5BVC9_BEUC1|nr:carbohydrate ABC transporter permease [Beutenbergia cavernae]ACQ80516.1 binding-protein-dependent transport systems inner membrane component [Beutenbergia cavernae DSM 12333]